jgi:hypothetical protein
MVSATAVPDRAVLACAETAEEYGPNDKKSVQLFGFAGRNPRRSHTAPPDRRTHCNQMEPGPEAALVRGRETAPCCQLTQAPFPEQRNELVKIVSEERFEPFPDLQRYASQSEQAWPANRSHPLSPPIQQSVLCIFLI